MSCWSAELFMLCSYVNYLPFLLFPSFPYFSLCTQSPLISLFPRLLLIEFTSHTHTQTHTHTNTYTHTLYTHTHTHTHTLIHTHTQVPLSEMKYPAVHSPHGHVSKPYSYVLPSLKMKE